MGQTLLTRRIWFHYPYVMPADVLSNEPTHGDDPSSLREEASCDDICYLKLICSFRDGTYLARVAASAFRASLSRLYRGCEQRAACQSAPLAQPLEERISETE